MGIGDDHALIQDNVSHPCIIVTPFESILLVTPCRQFLDKSLPISSYITFHPYKSDIPLQIAQFIHSLPPNSLREFQ